MATGASGRKILFVPTKLGTPAPPTVLPTPSAVPGPGKCGYYKAFLVICQTELD